jgi:hypothetical protein
VGGAAVAKKKQTKEETMTRRYYVGMGGAPKEQRVEHEDFASALDAALDMAYEVADREGIDRDNIDTWGEDDPDIGAGACPEGDPGGYWPHVIIRES